MKILGRIAIVLVLLLVLAALGLYGIGSGWFGRYERAGEIAGPALPGAVPLERAARTQSAAAARGVPEAKQILFGDFHVHTTFSFDAFLMSLPLAGGTGTHPPAEACDFARYCSQLDFWSINDHAENLTPRLWEETVAGVRQCNEVAGDPANPDLVTYLGWEWSQIGLTPDTHYGHKNVILLGTGDDEIPARPIASRPVAATGLGLPSVSGRALLGLANGRRGFDFATLLTEVAGADRCPDDVPVRDLPADCMESTITPEALFAKLREWDVPSLVIPHGTAWGLYSPAGADWRKQLPGSDPGLQNLVEIYSGHGSSEEYRPWRATLWDADGEPRCPEPSTGYLPSCWRSGEIVRAACLESGESEAVCEERAVRARQDYVEAGQGGWKTIGGHPADAWLDAGQCRDCFQTTFNHRPLGSVQYMLALRDFSDPTSPKRFELGFLSSSDNHSSKPGTGYKELGRGAMTEGRGGAGGGSGGGGGGVFGSSAGPPRAESAPFTEPVTSPLALFEIERASSFFVTGGLVAVHSAARDRNAIWEALERKEVYATSGPRILLWFDLIDDETGPLAMGSRTERSRNPRFRAHAVGSFEQQPGCPAFVTDALGRERTDEICLGECYHPSDRRRRITRIEVVRIRPQSRPDEPIDSLIDDPWRAYTCPADPGGCSIEFEDREFARAMRDAVYYVRAIEEPSQAIHGSNPLGCELDGAGNCVAVSPCGGRTEASDDCLSPTEQRAWSSPIYVDFARAGSGAAGDF